MSSLSRRAFIRTASLGLAGLTVACGGSGLPSAAKPTAAPPKPAAEKLRVGFVFSGPIGDFGWAWSHDQGRRMIEEKVPNSVTYFEQNVPENPPIVANALEDLVRRGCQLIFATSSGFLEPTLAAAKEFPKVTFIHIGGAKTATNVGTAFGKVEEPRYVSGLIAGKMTKSNQIGYVAAFPNAQVIRGINAFALGVRKANPAAKVKVAWTNTWNDEQKEYATALGLIDGGVDIIAQHQNTLGPQRAAETRGKYSVGYHSDMAPFAPKAVLTSAVWNWGGFYTQTATQVAQGTWNTGQYWGNWQEGVVDLSPFGPMVPPDVRAAATAEADRFKKGEASIFTLFTGPLKDHKGDERLKSGVALTATELLSINWLVEGVDATLPTP